VVFGSKATRRIEEVVFIWFDHRSAPDDGGVSSLFPEAARNFESDSG
jgi:hypothetical protein